jgi:hypothetical protein
LEKRIAAKLNTLPRWLIYKQKPTYIDEIDDIIVSDYLKSITNQNSLIPPIGPFPNDIKENEVQDIFIATNSFLLLRPNDRKNLFESMSGFYKDPERIFNDRTRILEKLKKDILSNKNNVDKYITNSSIVDNQTPINFTEPTLAHTQFTIEFNTPPNFTITHLFNLLQMSKHVPYASLLTPNISKPLFKIYKESEVNPQWLDVILDNVLFVKVDNDRDDVKPLNMKWKRFTSVAFTITSDGKLIATLDVNIGQRYVSKQEFINRLLSALPNFDVVSSVDNLIVVYFTFPRQLLNNIVFYELTMNNNLFNFIVAIDESTRASKLSQTVYLHRLGHGIDSVNIHQKFTTKHNQFGMINIGEPYVQCRMKTTNQTNVLIFRNILAKLFAIYNKEYDNVVSYYRKFIKDFAHVKVSNIKKSIAPKGLRAIAPEIFAPNFSRKCANAPSVVYTGETINGQTMDFPIHGESIGNEPIKTLTFTCKTDKHPYIGLRRNELENKELFPMVPCCFASDQINKKGSLYRKYFLDEKDNKKPRQHQDTAALARRLLGPKDYEQLPDKLKTLFSIIDKDQRVEYIRNGVTISKLASIEAILLGKGQINYKKQRATTVANIVNKYVNILDSDKFAMSTRQELYDKRVETIRLMIRNGDIRPSRFVNALELMFDCNIFIFSAENNGELMIPEHTRGYYKLKPSRETFLLYQHYGDTDRLATDIPPEYPHVELITRNNGTGFYPGDPVIKKLYNIFRRMTKTIINGKISSSIPNISLDITGQSVDAYGKCRIINVNNVTLVLLEPLPPFAAPNITEIYRITLDEAIKFAKNINSRIIWQRKDTLGSVVEICIDIGVNAVVLLKPSVDKVLKSVEISKELAQFSELQSSLKYFAKQNKTASILFEYTLWLIHNNFKSIDRDNLDDILMNFTTNFVEIDSNHVYHPYESATFTDPSSFVENNKLIVTSSDMIRRLIFMCRMKILQSKKIVYNNNAIPNFYSSSDDFDDMQNSFVLDGQDAVLNLISTYGIENIITNKIIDTTRPYYFKNILIDEKIYLAQPAQSIDEAISIVSSWTMTGINTSDDGNIDENVQIFSYVNQEEINLISDGDADIKKGCIIGYKQNNLAKYVSLLEI